MDSRAQHPAERVGAVADEAAARLERAGVPAARHDAERLLAHLLGTDRGGVVARRPDPLEPALARRFRELVERRARREPLQHLTRRCEFYGLELAVDRRALVPRPETEGLVDAVLAAAPPDGARVADLGTGGGCIAIALAATRSDLALVAVDRSEDALSLARANLREHGLDDRIELHAGDFARLPRAWDGTFDVVVSNPPYVAEDAADLDPELAHEPRLALFAGAGGTAVLERIALEAPAHLEPAGALALELAPAQVDGLRARLAAAGLGATQVHRDLAGAPRVVTARREAVAEAEN